MSPTSVSDFLSKDTVAVLLVLLSYFVYSLGDASIKYTLSFYPIIPVLFLNCFFSVCFMLGYGLWRSGPSYFKTKKLKYHAFRGVLGLMSIFLSIYALKHTTLSEFYMMVFTSPLWIVVLSMLVMKEGFDIIRTIIVILGFGVIVYVFMPGGELDLDLGLLAALGAALFFAINVIFIRKYLQGEAAALLGGSNSAFMCLAVAGFALPMIDYHFLQHIHFFIFNGFCVFFASLCLARAFQSVSHSVILAPIHYIQMIYGLVLGYFIFAEWPTSRTILGSMALIALGLCLIWYDYTLKKREHKAYGASSAKS